MTERLRLLQVGAGSMGRTWLRTIAADDRADVVGLVDLDEGLASRAAVEAGLGTIEVGTSLSEVYQRCGADAVVNVSVPRAHLPVNAEALRLGLPVLCEKPLSESLAECIRMAALSEVTNRLLMVSQSRRYFPAVAMLDRQLAALAAPVGYVSCHYSRSVRMGGFREQMANPLLIDMAIHHFDLARRFIGSTPVSVVAESWNPPWSWYAGDACATASFLFEGGARFTYTGSWCGGGLETSWNGEWRLATASGTATWDGDGAPQAARDDGTPIGDRLGEEPQETAGSLREFIDALRPRADGSPSGSPAGEAHDNVLSVAMVMAAIRSAEADGARIHLGDVLAEARNEALATEPDRAVREVIQAP